MAGEWLITPKWLLTLTLTLTLIGRRVAHYSKMAHFHVDSEFDAEFEHAMKQVFEDSGKILQMQDDGDMAEEGVKSAAEKASS